MNREHIIILAGGVAALGALWIVARGSAAPAAPAASTDLTAADLYPGLGTLPSPSPASPTPAPSPSPTVTAPLVNPSPATVTGPVLSWISNNFLPATPAVPAGQPANTTTGAPQTCCGVGGNQQVYGSLGALLAAQQGGNAPAYAVAPFAPAQPVAAGIINQRPGSGLTSAQLSRLLTGQDRSSPIETAGGQPISLGAYAPGSF
jgi:hypothetical protein